MRNLLLSNRDRMADETFSHLPFCEKNHYSYREFWLVRCPWRVLHYEFCPAMGGLQIPRWLGSDPLSTWWLGLAPATLEFWIPKREEPGKTGAPCVKVPGSSRVPPREQLCNRSCSNKHTHNKRTLLSSTLLSHR